ncbi:hypothetical protein HerbRD11066_27860 [Herbidospora sp. RD11066]
MRINGAGGRALRVSISTLDKLSLTNDAVERQHPLESRAGMTAFPDKTSMACTAVLDPNPELSDDEAPIGASSPERP